MATPSATRIIARCTACTISAAFESPRARLLAMDSGMLTPTRKVKSG